MQFISIADSSDIPEGAMKSFAVNGKGVLISNYKGNYFAINKKCSHMGGDLSKGRLEGKIVICPLHGSRFDITNGKCTQGPKIGFIKLKTGDINIYPVKIEDGKIHIGI